jgi:hypothetical protein
VTRAERKAARDKQAAMASIRARQHPDCFLAKFSTHPCDGQLVRCHLIPKQKLKAIWHSVHSGKPANPHLINVDLSPWPKMQDLIWDRRTWVWGCGGPMGNAGHHGMLDHSRTIQVPFEALPVETFELARHLELVWWLETEYLR